MRRPWGKRGGKANSTFRSGERTSPCAPSCAGFWAPVAAKPAAPRREKARKLSYKEMRELETIEETILAAEEEVARTEASFEDPEFLVERGHEWAALATKLKAKKDEISSLYARWEELERIKAQSP